MRGKKCKCAVSVMLCMLLVMLQVMPTAFALDVNDADVDAAAGEAAYITDGASDGSAGDASDLAVDADGDGSGGSYSDASGSPSGEEASPNNDAANDNAGPEERAEGEEKSAAQDGDQISEEGDDGEETGENSGAADETAEANGDAEADLLEAADDTEQLPEWYENGKNTGIFEIGSASALREFADIVNKGVTTFSGKTVALTGDIDMAEAGDGAVGEVVGEVDEAADAAGWEPIGSSTALFFAGTFNGNGHAIKNIRMASTDENETYTGLFGYLRGTVTDLTLESCEFDTASKYAGGIAGYLGAAGAVTDCSIKGVSLSASGRYVGAAAGYLKGAISDVTVTGSVRADSLVSYPKTDDEPEEYCYGGAVGAFAGTEMRHIINRADVTVKTDIKNTSIYIGGIAGRTCDGASLILNCGNSGSISCDTASVVYAGGIAGASDAGSVKNCWNKGTVACGSVSGLAACAGGLFGESKVGNIYNSYNDNAGISGDVNHTGYIVGNIASEDAPTVLDYVYWPGNGTYTSKSVYGNGSIPADIQTTCRGIKKIVSSSSLIKRLNAQVIASCGESGLTTELYMWKLTNEDDPKSSPEFREEAPEPVFPNKPSITVDNDEVMLHVAEADPAHSAVIDINVTNSDPGVVMEYQWQVSRDNISFSNITAGTAASEREAGAQLLSVSGKEAGIEYYRLKVNCSDESADTDRAYYSNAVTVKTGWRVKLAPGGYLDGGAITGGGAADDVFPVIPDSGAVALPKAISDGNYFLGYAGSYTAGQVYELSELMTEFDTAGMTGDVTLWSIFRPAAKVTVTIDAGSESAEVIEGVTEDRLSFIMDEGRSCMMPDGNELFVNDGWRFMGWRVSEKAAEAPEDAEDSDNGGNGEKADDNAVKDIEGQTGDAAGGAEDDDTDNKKIYAPGEAYTVGTADITLTAVWSKLYTVSYESTSSYTGELPETAQYIGGEAFKIPDAAITRDGYKLKNWIDSSAHKQYKAGDTYVMPAGDVVLTANWIVLFQITFEPSEDSSINVTGTESLTRTVNVGEGEFLKLPDQGDMAAEGYKFMGWSDTSNIGSIFKPGQSYYITMPESFYGVWYKISRVTFDRGSIDGETISGDDPEAIECTEGTEIQLPLSPYKVTTNKEGVKTYKLIGWKDNTTGFIRSPLSKVTVGKNDLSYTAQWRAVGKEDSWNGEYKEIENGTGTASDPYLIKTPEELAYVSHMVIEGKDTKNTYFSLENDVDMTDVDWTPIGMYYSDKNGKSLPFEGVFNGNGHSITGITSMYDMSGSLANVGLFGYIGKSGQVNDLNVIDADITASIKIMKDDGSSKSFGQKCIGILAGISSGEISGCTVSGVLTLNQDTEDNENGIYVGAICGNSVNASIKSCRNDAAVRFLKTKGVGGKYENNIYTAGITGKAQSAEIEDCINNGDVTFDSIWHTENRMGGITAYADADSSISGCENNGNVSHNDTGDTMVGGIVGEVYCDVSDCTNNGKIEYMKNTGGGSEGYQFVGGIAGENHRSVTKCTNNGEVTNSVTDAYHHVSAAGGISGAALGDIIKCGNTGSISMDAYVDILDSYYHMSTGPENEIRGINVTAGGVVGALCNAAVKNSFSYGKALTSLYGNAYNFRIAENAWLAMSDGGIAGLVCNEYTHWYWKYLDAKISKSSITDCYWLASRQPDPDAELLPTDYEGIYASYADGSRRIKAGERVGGRTEEQFRSGEVAYLIDGGAGSRANSWTQGSDYTDLGSPQYYKAYVDIENSNGSASLKYGTNEGQTVYAPSDGEVGIVMPKGISGYEQAYGDKYDQYDESVKGGVIHHWKQDYYVNVPTVTIKKVKGGEKVEAEKDQNGSDLKFNMPSADVVVQLAFMEQDAFNELIEKDPSSLTKVTRNESQFEAVEEPEPKPEPEPTPEPSGGGGSGNGGGSGGSNGDGKVADPGAEGSGVTSNPENGTGENNTSTDGVENGTGIPDSSSIAPSEVNTADNVLISQEAPALSDVTETAESAPQQAGEPSADNSETEQEDAEEEPEEEINDPAPDVYEVIKDVVKNDPAAMILLIVLIAVIIAAAALRRVRRASK